MAIHTPIESPYRVYSKHFVFKLFILKPAQKMTKSAEMPKNWSTLSFDRSPLAHFYRHLSLSNDYLGLG